MVYVLATLATATATATATLRTLNNFNASPIKFSGIEVKGVEILSFEYNSRGCFHTILAEKTRVILYTSSRVCSVAFVVVPASPSLSINFCTHCSYWVPICGLPPETTVKWYNHECWNATALHSEYSAYVRTGYVELVLLLLLLMMRTYVPFLVSTITINKLAAANVEKFQLWICVDFRRRALFRRYPNQKGVLLVRRWPLSYLFVRWRPHSVINRRMMIIWHNMAITSTSNCCRYV